MTVLGNPDVESAMEAKYWKAIGGDVVCPPDPCAICKHCGTELQYHLTDDDPEIPVTPETAVCLDDAALLRKRVVYNRFELAPGYNFDCRAVTTCDVCCVQLCSEHSTNFTTCAENPHSLHHLVCVDHCHPCSMGYRMENH